MNKVRNEQKLAEKGKNEKENRLENENNGEEKGEWANNLSEDFQNAALNRGASAGRLDQGVAAALAEHGRL